MCSSSLELLPFASDETADAMQPDLCALNAINTKMETEGTARP